MKIDVMYTSVWDGGYEVGTKGEVDLETGIAESLEVVDDEDLDIHDESYIEYLGERYDIEEDDDGDDVVVEIEKLRSLIEKNKLHDEIDEEDMNSQSL